MSDKQPPVNPFDPRAWRESRDTYLNAWSKIMVEAVNSEQYAQAAGTLLDSYLTASSPFRQVVEKSMLRALEQLSMPSRQDVVALAERMTHIEMRLDDMDAKLDQALKLRPAAPTPRSARAKRPTVNAGKRSTKRT